jgi:hypothetical protein
MKLFLTFFFLLVFTSVCSANPIWAEKTGEAIYRQLELEKQLQSLIDQHVDKELQVTIGNVSLVVDIFLKQRIVWKTTFP